MTKRNLSFIAASLAVAAGLWFAKVLIAPPVSEAAVLQGVDPELITMTAGKNLPLFETTYERHIGVLDTLKPTP